MLKITIRPFLGVIFLTIISILATSSPAMAQSITISTTSGPVDTMVSVTGIDFNASVPFQTYFAYGTVYQTIVSTGTVSSTGTISSIFRIPTVPAGTYTVRVQTSTKNASTTFMVTSAISLNVSSSIVGNQVTITGTGYTASRVVTIWFDNTQIASTSTNNYGKFSASFATPETFGGTHTITATDGIYPMTATLSVVPTMMISPTSGIVGTTINISGNGFGASRVIKITFDGVNVSSIPSTINTNNLGTFSATFTVPAGPARSVQVSASDGTNTKSTPYNLIATIGLTPTNGKVGTPVTVTGSGFNASRKVDITFDNAQVRQVSTDAYGNFSTSFDIPAATGGQHPVTANDGVRAISGTFTIANNMVVTPNSGKVGTEVNITGSGFRSNRTVNVYFDNSLVATTQSNASGSFSTTFNMVATTSGTHTISVHDGAYTTNSSFIIQPGIVLNQASGKMGGQVNITGTGFEANRTLTIRLGNTKVRSTTTDANGSFSDKFTIPQLEVGNYNLSVDDGVNTASIIFTVTTSFNISPTTGYVGNNITVQGNGYNDLITIKYDDTVVATVIPNVEGSFSTTFIVPISVHGLHTVSVGDNEATLQTTFTMESMAPSVPIILAPQLINRENARPTLTWQGVSDQSGVIYNLQVASDSNFNTIVLEKNDLTTTQYNVTDSEKLKSNDKESPYYWRVQAVDLASNQSQWSAAGSFYVSFMADWVRFTLIGLGSVIAALIIFWAGMITGRKGWTKETD